MSDRKETMLEMADVFVALPGGIGTLDEISEAINLNEKVSSIEAYFETIEVDAYTIITNCRYKYFVYFFIIVILPHE